MLVLATLLAMGELVYQAHSLTMSGSNEVVHTLYNTVSQQESWMNTLNNLWRT